MILTGTFEVSASPGETWDLLMDPAMLCKLASSCEEAHQIDATHYEGTVRAKLSLVTIRVTILGEILQAERPQNLRVALQGKTSGMPGSFTGAAELQLHGGPAGTRGEYTLQVNALGNLGSLGEPFLQKTAQRMADTFAEKLSRYLSSGKA